MWFVEKGFKHGDALILEATKTHRILETMNYRKLDSFH